MATKTNAAGDLGDAARKLNEKIDCEDLALRLGLERPGGKGNFRSPHHADKAPSVSVYQGKDGLSRWQDHSLGSGPGTGGAPSACGTTSWPGSRAVAAV